ncbi:MAG: nitroreductase family deazaflavin-dependent oxidoreductase [Acidimicrobiia bacterium]|nr:nitroreductase family deazaflavin-dependent oxidoreductase [Acidimicrobiia bacterium]
MIDLDRAAVINLTTLGRVTGRPHRIEIWFAHHEATIYMLSGGGDRSDWVRNIIANQAVTVSVGGSDFVGRGRIVVDPGEQQLARNTVFAKYTKSYGGDLTRWRETALPVAVDIDAAPRFDGIAEGGFR